MMPPDDLLHRKFIRLFTEHEPAVRTFVRSLVPMRSDAAEVMQKVALVLLFWAMRKVGMYLYPMQVK